ncbi:MAG: Uma2 family endonuclease [Candidatus Poribacteria bacterium]|nr:Uma2 family endonuclease [Candidatus Poribacteria bacterium]
MAIHEKEEHIPSAPTDASIFYPEEDGEPMAVSDLHRRILMRTLQVFDEYFKQDPGAYVSGDILMYYVEGDPRKSVSPDVLVAFGLGKKPRGNYLVWVEGKVPDFAMEFSSKNTYQNDLGHKMELYASLGIQDYFLCDIEGLYLPSPLMGFTLVDGVYVPISANVDGGLHSPALNLDFHIGDVGRWLHSPVPNLDFPADVMGLGIYDPVGDAWLQTPAESALAQAELASARAENAETRAETAETRAETAETRAENAEARAETAETRAEQEAIARQEAEAENARLQAELTRLQARSS